MIILDENIIDSQCRLLQSWHIHFKQIGFETGTKGLKDKEIIGIESLIRELNEWVV